MNNSEEKEQNALMELLTNILTSEKLTTELRGEALSFYLSRHNQLPKEQEGGQNLI